MQAFYVIVFSLLSANIGCTAAHNVGIEDTLLKILQGLEDVKNQLNSLQAVFESKTTFFSNSCSIKDITDAITANKFKLAEEQLVDLADKKKITQIVHIVYASSPANMDIILNFAKYVKDCDVKFRLFTALHDEMRAGGNSDPFKLINLIETMEKALAREKNPKADIKAKAQDDIQGAIESVKDASVNIFKTAMINNKYLGNADVEALSTAIFHFRTDVSDEVMERVVDNVFGVVGAKKIIRNINSHKHILQVITGLTAIFNRFNYGGNLNNDAVLDLALHLKNLRQRHDYAPIDQKFKSEIDGIIERLPTCAKNLYFYTNLCLWSKSKGAYMHAASSEYNFDKERRNLFTGHTGNIVNGAVWHVEKIGDYYFFKNADYANEYLYSLAGGPRDNKDTRFVFTWIPGYNTDEQSRWTIELDGNHCYLRSAYINEYLFASSEKYNEFNSYVFTRVSPTQVRSTDFQWELRNCDRGGN